MPLPRARLDPRGQETPGGHCKAERARGWPRNYEVLFIIDFLDFKDFLGSPILLLGFPRIS